MASRLIALIAAVSLLAGIVHLPAAAVPTTAAGTHEHSHHHCCPKLEGNQMVAVIPALPSLPCGPNHSCCVARPPAKLPSLPAGPNAKADRPPVHAMKVGLPAPDEACAIPGAKSISIHGPLDLSTVLRI